MRLIDADSVVNELKREKFIESETVLSDIHQGYNAGLNRAIEIVKRGGRDEKTAQRAADRTETRTARRRRHHL